jgi:para-nitrobenzyl esterase
MRSILLHQKISFGLVRTLFVGLVAAYAAAAGMVANAAVERERDEAVFALTDKGVVKGVETRTMNKFLGIPYAAAPVGNLRWQPPQPHASWHGPLDATQFGNHCPQSAGPFGLASNTEDCLFLNVYTPNDEHEGRDRDDRRGRHEDGRPVMVWIHGGALTVGESDDYDPTNLVKQGVVVVTINYRLGVLGYLSHPALTAESPNLASGNYGFMDQQAAIKWVHRNIKHFGGDADNVTIFGESAGGLSVHTQLASPLAAGLFERAIIESGAYQMNTGTMAANEARGATFGGHFGCPAPTTAACLRAIPVASILTEPAVRAISAPVVDNLVLTQSIAAALTSGNFNRVPVMEGSNHDEWRLFVAFSFEQATPPFPVNAATYKTATALSLGATTPAAIAATIASLTAGGVFDVLYPLANFPAPQPQLTVGAIGTDAIFACNSRTSVRRLANFVPVFAYEFNDANAPELFLPPATFPFGAAHASEIQYLFGLRPSVPDPVALNEDQRRLSRDMVHYWTQFARNGDPNSRHLTHVPFWPAYDRTADQFQSLTPPGPSTESGFAADHKCAFWAPGS